MTLKRLRPHYSLILFLITAAILILLLASSAAQADGPQIPARAMEDLAAALKVSPNDPEFQDIFKKINGQLQTYRYNLQQGILPKDVEERIEQGLQQTRDLKPAGRNLMAELGEIKIIKHYKADNGVPLKQLSLVPAEVDIEKIEVSQEIKEAGDKTRAEMKAAIEALKNTPPLPACSEEKVERELLNPDEPVTKKTNQIVMDILYLRGKAPLNADEMFGTKTKLIACPDEPGNGCAIGADEMGLECLPTRFQIVDGELIRMEGAAALKNFDQQRNGVMTDAVKRQLSSLIGE